MFYKKIMVFIPFILFSIIIHLSHIIHSNINTYKQLPFTNFLRSMRVDVLYIIAHLSIRTLKIL